MCSRDDWRRELEPNGPSYTQEGTKTTWAQAVSKHLAVKGFICPAYTRVPGTSWSLIHPGTYVH